MGDLRFYFVMLVITFIAEPFLLARFGKHLPGKKWEYLGPELYVRVKTAQTLLESYREGRLKGFWKKAFSDTLCFGILPALTFTLDISPESVAGVLLVAFSVVSVSRVLQMLTLNVYGDTVLSVMARNLKK